MAVGQTFVEAIETSGLGPRGLPMLVGGPTCITIIASRAHTLLGELSVEGALDPFTYALCCGFGLLLFLASAGYGAYSASPRKARA